ncbi:MAG: hypothetical protein E7812_08885 [Phenylobacterium sp.]|nr:MAG: hypothetical protein E7812_08885 [Phenylobacterium sp.]
MSTGDYCHLRSGVDDADLHDGRIGYHADRSSFEVSTGAGVLSRIWLLRFWGRADEHDPVSPHYVTLTAVDTAVPDMPEKPDAFTYWRHTPLLLTAGSGDQVRLGAVGHGIAPEAGGYWIAERRLRPHPAGGKEPVTTLRLESMANRGLYLCHQRDPDTGALGTSLTLGPSRLALHAQDNADQDMWWRPEPIAVDCEAGAQSAVVACA